MRDRAMVENEVGIRIWMVVEYRIMAQDIHIFIIYNMVPMGHGTSTGLFRCGTGTLLEVKNVQGYR